jgi:hypothetical protein
LAEGEQETQHSQEEQQGEENRPLIWPEDQETGQQKQVSGAEGQQYPEKPGFSGSRILLRLMACHVNPSSRLQQWKFLPRTREISISIGTDDLEDDLGAVTE